MVTFHMSGGGKARAQNQGWRGSFPEPAAVPSIQRISPMPKHRDGMATCCRMGLPSDLHQNWPPLYSLWGEAKNNNLQLKFTQTNPKEKGRKQNTVII